MIARDIAGRLTAAQRRAVLTSDLYFAARHKGKWNALAKPTASRLFKLGLIEDAQCLTFPTPLGLEVRAILKEAPDAE